MIKTLGTTLAVAAVLALGAGAGAQATPSQHSRIAHSKAKRCKRSHHHGRRHRCVARKHRKAHHAKKARTAAVVASSLDVVNTTSSSTQVSWKPVPAATTARIRVNGHLVDAIAASDTGSYQVQQLWPSTSYSVTVGLRDNKGRLVASYRRVVTTAPRSGSVHRLYSPDTFINTPIGPSPALEANSDEIVSQAFGNYSSNANLANSDSWGVPVYQASAQSPSYTVGCMYYGCWYDFAPFHIPANAQPQYGSDGHMVVMQDDGQEMDMWIAQHDGNGWTSGSRWVTNAYGSAANCTRVHGCGSADVAGFALAAGLVRPEEIAQGHIDHALAITTPYTRSNYIACPATDTDGHHDDPNALPVGAHVQLDPNIKVADLPIPRWEKVIAVALQQYGAYVIDTGGSVALYAESNLDRPYNAWARVGVSSDSPNLSALPWRSMRVLSMTQCGG